MKVSNIKGLTCSQKELAIALGLTPSRISALIKEGIVIRDEDDASGGVKIVESLLNYQAKRGDNQQSIDYWNEKALHEKAKREITEIKLKKLDNELYDASMVEQFIAENYVKFRTQLLNIPAKLSMKLEGESKERIMEIMTEELEEKLNELSELTMDEDKRRTSKSSEEVSEASEEAQSE